MSSTNHDELTVAVFGAVESLSPLRKANFLLQNALDLIEVGKYVIFIS